MSITKIKASNFKSFKNLELELGNFNVLIGTNASGKSNFVEIFRFLRDIANHDLETAISMHGGLEYLPNINLEQSGKFSLGFTSNQKFGFGIENKNKKLIGIKSRESNYNLTLNLTEEKPGFKISEEILTLKCKFFELEREKDSYEEKKELGKGKITLSNIFGHLNLDLEKTGKTQLEGNDIIPDSIFTLIESVIVKKPFISLLNTPLSSFPVPWKSILTDVAIYDFDPKLCKETIKITDTAGLEENGKNLAIILRSIIEDEEESRRFFNFLGDLLPLIDNIFVENFVDKSYIFTLKEKYSNKYLPASYVSDGTINIIAMIIALYFETVPFIIIEEPERNIHPYLISRIAEMMRESSKEKQIIVTTHNPELLKYTGLKNIYFISRDKKGFSTISKPSEKEEVRSFLENHIGIEELYIDNLLGE